MRIRQARKILRIGRFNPMIWGYPGRGETRRRAQKRVEQWLGGRQGVISLGRAMGL